MKNKDEILYRRFETREGYAYEPAYPTHMVSDDGKNWKPAKEEPYYPLGIEWLKCTFGFHELVQSKKYAHTKYCFRCGKRKTDPKFYH